MTASAEIRAERRFLEMQEKSANITFDEVLKNVVERDKIDSSREDSPLIVAENAVMIDNSNLNKEQQFNMILDLAHKAINAV